MNVLDQPCAFKLVFEPPDHSINDHCFIRDDNNTWHLFYIYFPRDRRRSNTGHLEYGIGHAISRDLLNWECVGIPLRETPNTWENDAIYAPYVFRLRTGKYVMLYCGVNQQSQQIGTALSDNLFTWTKFDGNPVIKPNPRWSNWESRGYHSCRDPHVLALPSGEYLCYYTANTRDPTVCCIAAATSTDGMKWSDRGPVYTATLNYPGPGQGRMESAGVIPLPEGSDRKFMLFFTFRWGVVYLQSNDLLSFSGEPQRLGPYHASEIFFEPASQQWLISSCCQNIGALHLPGAGERNQVHGGRGLFLAGLGWIEGNPVVLDLKHCLRIPPEERLSRIDGYIPEEVRRRQRLARPNIHSPTDLST